MSTQHDICNDLSFESFTLVKTLHSIAHLFGTSTPRCGIYLLGFPDKRYYIGKAIDVVRRFAQHRKNHLNIELFSFVDTSKEALNDLEKMLIQKAEHLGYLLKNIVHVSTLQGDSDLDMLVSAQTQSEWEQRQPTGFRSFADLHREVILPSLQTERFDSNFKRYLLSSHQEKATAILATYLRGCLIAPRQTEYSFWSVSCTPSTNINTYPRLYAVNAASMELLVCGVAKKSSLEFGFLTVADDVLEKHWPDPHVFLSQFKTVEFIDRNYRDAGSRQITLHVSSFDDLLALLQDQGVSKAAGVLALRVMRKRGNFYSQFHCTQLVDYVLENYQPIHLLH